MATYEQSLGGGSGSGKGVAVDRGFFNPVAGVAIPRYSVLSSVIFSGEVQQGTWGSTGDISVVTKNGNTTAATLWEKEHGVPYNSYAPFSSSNVVSAMYTSGINCGNVKNASSIAVRFSSLLSRTYTYRNLKCVFTYTPPTYSINALSNNSRYGTVSGGGTWDVQISSQTKSISANAKTGYRFVRWNDGNTQNPRSITFSDSTISAQSTTETYTAVFEPIKYYLDLNGYIDNVEVGSLSPAGTADIYINGNRVADDVADFYTPYDYGSTYEIKDIKSNPGYSYYGVKIGSLTGTITEDTSVLLGFKVAAPRTCTVNFKNADGSVLSSKTVTSGNSVGTLPTPTRNGYSFGGWLPCAPARTMQNAVLDSAIYTGQSNSFNALLQSYKFEDAISIHVEAYMDIWEEIQAYNAQILSCTENGGWGLGYQANTGNVHGAELKAGGAYKAIDFRFGSAGAFSNNAWHSFDITFSNGTFEAYVDGVKKGSQAMGGNSIQYGNTNTIFVGAEAWQNTEAPANGYFKGIISNVFIANTGTRLVPITANTVISDDIDYYPIWHKDKLPEITNVEITPNPARTGQGLAIRVTAI